MNHDEVDTRATAYVFGELSPDETQAFERELSQSSGLRDEVASIRETVGALKNEFDAKATSLGDSQRQIVEAAIQQRSSSGAVNLDHSVSRFQRKSLFAAALAASVLIAGLLVYPYLADQDVALVTSPSEPQPTSEILMEQEESAAEFADADLPTESPAIESATIVAGIEPMEEAVKLQEQVGATIGGGAARGSVSQMRVELKASDVQQSVRADHPFPADELESLAQSSPAPASQPAPSAAPMSGAKGPSRQLSAADQIDSPHPFGGGAAAAQPGVARNQPRAAGAQQGAAGNQQSLGRSAGQRGRNQSGQPAMPQQAAERPKLLKGRSLSREYRLGDRSNLAGEEDDGALAAADAFGRGQATAGALYGNAEMKSDTELGGSIAGRQSGLNRVERVHESAADPLADATPQPRKRSRRGMAMGADKSIERLAEGLEMEMEGESVDAFALGTEVADRDEVAAVAADASGIRDVERKQKLEPELELEANIAREAIIEKARGDRFDPIEDNPFFDVSVAPLSTFSADVDTASYAKVRALLNQGTLPRPDAVRLEELINYFHYDYQPPQDQHPFAASVEIASCPWNADHRLARVAIKGKVVEETRPSSNLVFLLDVSGSMDQPKKMPLMIEGMKLLTEQLSENDRVSIVVYAGAAGQVLEPTRGDQKSLILGALDRLRAGGSTNGAQGITLAYQLALDNFIEGGTNRVILCTDGDFNVGLTGDDQLVQLAKENAKSNVFLSVFGFGTGNHNDSMMEKVSNNGNGNYAFIDSAAEAEKVFVNELGGTLVTIAKDVKIQIEFNPKQVASYRQIGYENRQLEDQDFINDKKDGGEIGAGHTVTALYEIVPAEVDDAEVPKVEPLRYQRVPGLTKQADSGETLFLKLRYKQPEGDKSIPIEVPVTDAGKQFSQADQDFQFAASVAAFGMLLRNSPYKGDATFAAVAEIADAARDNDEHGYRQEFLELVHQAKELSGE